MPYLECWQIFAPHWPRTTSAQIVTQEKARSASQKYRGKFSMVGEHRVSVRTGEVALNRGLVTGTQAHSKDLEQSRGQCKKKSSFGSKWGQCWAGGISAEREV